MRFGTCRDGTCLDRVAVDACAQVGMAPVPAGWLRNAHIPRERDKDAATAHTSENLHDSRRPTQLLVESRTLLRRAEATSCGRRAFIGRRVLRYATVVATQEAWARYDPSPL